MDSEAARINKQLSSLPWVGGLLRNSVFVFLNGSVGCLPRFTTYGSRKRGDREEQDRRDWEDRGRRR